MAAKSYRELLAWQRAMDLVVEVYRLTKRFPREKLYGLTHQLRRAVVSIPSNIAEGQGRGEGEDFRRYLRIAIGSLQEVKTQIIVAQRLNFADSQDIGSVMAIADEVGKLVRGLCASIRTSN